MWDRGRIGARPCSESRSDGSRRLAEGELVGTSEGKRHIPALASDTRVARGIGVPACGWKNHLHPSASVACSSFVGRPVSQAEARSLKRGAYTFGQAQAAGHAVSRLGAK